MSTPFIAEIRYFGFNYAPQGWALCQGQLLSIANYSTVYALVGTTYGGDGHTTFGLPDLRGRVAKGQGSGPGRYPRYMGQTGGYDATNLSVANMPSHNHGVTFSLVGTTTCNGEDGGQGSPAGKVLGTGANAYAGYGSDQMSSGNVAISGTINTAAQGGGQSFDNNGPFLVVNPCIALTGDWPSRP
ncbi:MAG: phage tail protein [Gemmatimonadales bacterium]|nr:phage tail protein [Gemmatimonadales bacterium]NIN10043.1 phage tail protein [Gemmatimonadales bacterium]NIQ98696.1 phage tail protein [Gemmatimonadales bacterium]NIS63572.1 phage tail protein [Gemmatimonadales bacterium]